MVDEQALLEVLTGVGEVQAEQFGVAAGAVVLGGRRHAHEIAAERHGEVAQHGIAAEASVMRGDVYGVVGPVLHRDDLQLCAVAEHELDVLA